MAERNRLLISPEDDFAYGAGIPRDATWRNLIPAAELGLAMAPGSGEAMAARDSWNAAGRGSDAIAAGQYGDAAGNYANALLALGGAIPGAGIIARGTRRGTDWMNRNLPEGFNRLLDAATPKASQDTMYSIPAWHGSPHDFDEFQLDKIGTGEGAQAYGHGLYFAENPSVAKAYQENLAAQSMTMDGKPFAPSNYSIVEIVGKNQGNPDGLKKDLQAYIAAYKDNPYASANEAEQILDGIQRGTFASTKQGRLYKTELDVEPEDLLDWDKPLSEQSEKIRAAVKSLFTKENGLGHVQDIDHLPGENILQLLRMGKAGPDKAAGVLREAGIPGIRYLDQGSRGGGEGTRNFVIFDDQLVKITGKE